VFVPPLALSTDNAAMIAAAGLRRYRSGRDGRDGRNHHADDWTFNAEASLPL
jgi:tRNA A37 threonylcarbamoyltransferase TsaD